MVQHYYHLRGLLTAQKYPAKNICPDCPAQKKMSFPLSPLVSFLYGLAKQTGTEVSLSDGSVGLCYIRNTKV
jgi:hypothetical protein